MTEDKWLDGIINSMDLNLSKFRDIVKDREAWCATVHVVTKSRTRLSDSTTNPPMFTAALFTIARTRKQPKYPLTDNENVVHIQMGYYLVKRKICVICKDVDGSRDCHTQ